jgi:hypothetical protein
MATCLRALTCTCFMLAANTQHQHRRVTESPVSAAFSLPDNPRFPARQQLLGHGQRRRLAAIRGQSLTPSPTGLARVDGNGSEVPATSPSLAPSSETDVTTWEPDVAWHALVPIRTTPTPATPPHAAPQSRPAVAGKQARNLHLRDTLLVPGRKNSRI